MELPSPGQAEMSGFRCPSVRLNLHESTNDVIKMKVIVVWRRKL